MHVYPRHENEELMNIIRVLAMIAAVAFFAVSPSSLAAPSCTEWMPQDDGSYFRTCVDDNGNHIASV